MATDAERSVEAMQRGLRFFAEDMARAEKASKGVAENLHDLGIQVQHGHRDFMEYVASGLKLPGIFKEMSMALVRQNDEVRKSIVGFKDQQNIAEATLELLKQQKKAASAAGDAATVKILKSEQKIYREMRDETIAAINLENSRLNLRQKLLGITGKQLAVEFILVKTFATVIQQTGQINAALIQANSDLDKRNDLAQQIYQVQAETGASFDHMLGASKALTNVFPKARADFQSTLKVIIQMEEGLGVSVENSSELARIFQINLKTPVREVADQIAIIANSTSLAADEATRFSTEVGKALRLLGPGAAPGARQVAGYVTMLAARMKDVGGDANEIIRLFTEMNKGTSQGFMLRGLSGVNSPGALGNEGGAQAAMQGLGRIINQIVTARPGTMAYSAQLEAAAQMLGTTTDTVLLFRQALEEAKKPLDEHAKLEQRWREQVTSANTSLQRLRESFLTLIHQAVLPFIPYLNKLFGALANVAAMVASSKIAITVAFGVVVFAIGKTVVALYQLGAAILQVAADSAIASKFMTLRKGFSAEGIAAQGGGFLTKYFGSSGTLINAIKAAATTQVGLLSSPGTWKTAFSSLFRTGPLAAIAASALAGYTIGTVLDQRFPNNWMSRLARNIAEAHYSKQYASLTIQKPGEKPVWEIMAEIRREALRGNMDAAMKIFEEGKYKVAGLRTEKGAQQYLEFFKKNMADVREKIGLSSVTAVEPQTLANDRRLIDLTQQQVNSSGEYLKRVREFENRMNARADRERAAAEKQRMLDEADFRMGAGTNAAPRKFSLVPEGHFLP
jgi:hypothetical protein